MCKFAEPLLTLRRQQSHNFLATLLLSQGVMADDSFYSLINAHHEQIHCTLPDAQWSSRWQLIFATDSGWEEDSGTTYAAGDVIRMEARSLWVLRAAGDKVSP